MSGNLKIAEARLVDWRRECLLLSTRCVGCGQDFEFWQGTISGLPCGLHSCPHCDAAHELEIEVGCEIIKRALPERTIAEAVTANEVLTRLAESWHRQDPWREALHYKGLDLGAPLEREISHHLTLHLSPTQEGSRS